MWYHREFYSKNHPPPPNKQLQILEIFLPNCTAIQTNTNFLKGQVFITWFFSRENRWNPIFLGGGRCSQIHVGSEAGKLFIFATPFVVRTIFGLKHRGFWKKVTLSPRHRKLKETCSVEEKHKHEKPKDQKIDLSLAFMIFFVGPFILKSCTCFYLLGCVVPNELRNVYVDIHVSIVCMHIIYTCVYIYFHMYKQIDIYTQIYSWKK